MFMRQSSGIVMRDWGDWGANNLGQTLIETLDKHVRQIRLEVILHVYMDNSKYIAFYLYL